MLQVKSLLIFLLESTGEYVFL